MSHLPHQMRKEMKHRNDLPRYRQEEEHLSDFLLKQEELSPVTFKMGRKMNKSLTLL